MVSVNAVNSVPFNFPFYISYDPRDRCGHVVSVLDQEMNKENQELRSDSFSFIAFPDHINTIILKIWSGHAKEKAAYRGIASAVWPTTSWNCRVAVHFVQLLAPRQLFFFFEGEVATGDQLVSPRGPAFKLPAGQLL